MNGSPHPWTRQHNRHSELCLAIDSVLAAGFIQPTSLRSSFHFTLLEQLLSHCVTLVSRPVALATQPGFASVLGHSTTSALHPVSMI
ncbi:hypothetical protein IF1G_03116 [Cordyceps javanica]|uniref:Uncharacterized protein n=1 Tax=Cordyceps javanica TaxID=43265 RepID=A0A545VBC3_9HYPO|nr:hypothetical protein IF1G_03116 [Cordyceps javanica]TQW10251.1 hypothetical protein IF2G_03041 [Cordyceps javanica]